MGLMTPDFKPASEAETLTLSAKVMATDKAFLARNGFAKRAMDIAISSLALLFLSPLLIALFVIVKMSSPGPALYQQRRLGQNGKVFGMYKFRTMYMDSDDLLEAILNRCPLSAEEWNTYQKLRCDPRITRPGHFLRKASLDELPQLLNVLKGDMSIVGQRPLLPEQKETYGAANFMQYMRGRPGITGLWQVSGRNMLPFEKRAELDTLYSQRWSLGYDIKILVQTIPVVLFPDGAF